MKKIKNIAPCILWILVFISAGSMQKEKTIMFFGDSLTAGYGLGQDAAFPNLIQEKINENKLDYKVINSGLSGETSAGGLDRIGWVLKQPVDIFVLELGANDGLRGLRLEATQKNLQEIINQVKANSPNTKIVLAGMMVPPNMGEEYSDQFVKIYSELARKNKALLIPFLLDGVAGMPELNQADGIHPNAEGHQIVAENVWEVISTAL